MRRYGPTWNALRFADGSHNWLQASWAGWHAPLSVTLTTWFRAVSEHASNGVNPPVDIATGDVETLSIVAFLLRVWRGRLRLLP